ncbi:MAG: class I SAM-dependent methyltransferase [Bacilli bacterium]|jgi:tRNA (adenine22-N1)-methyltransferase|nr:class I SAM-dependent methyltransferase [Bacilli bacterium]
MKISNRLLKIASFVKRDVILVDVGCDHGYLPIFLLNNKLIKQAYALDLREGPLSSVKNNALKYHIDLTCLISDGLEVMNSYYFDTVIIAGMGGNIISNIIAAQLSLLDNKELILQPQNNSIGLRKFLLKNHFVIIDECLVEERDVIYEIIIVKKNKIDNYEDYSELALNYGKHNLLIRDELLIKKMQQDLKKYQNILLKLNNTIPKYEDIKNKIKIIEDYIYEN